MTQQSRAEAYQALDQFIDGCVDRTEDITPHRQPVIDAIDAAVDEAYQAGYKAAMAEMEETLTEGFNPEYKDAGTARALLIKDPPPFGGPAHPGHGTWKAEL